ncbi:MAG: hypothetical protein HY941_13085 [Gammaproteobacteria bacterium]|nr:hypothetical protein [Gammaproteobacteria bacterium]
MATLKFPQLALGQGFVFRGTRYVKVSPLLARAEDSGHSQMIPRSAQVELLDVPATAGVEKNPAHVALEELHRAALDCLEELAAHAPPQAVSRARQRLAAARQRALEQLGLRD